MEDSRLLSACRGVGRLAAIAAGYAMLMLAGLVGFEVVGRKLFDFSLQGVDEIGGYVLAAVATFGFSYALLSHAHTRVDIFVQTMSTRPQVVLYFLSVASLAGFGSFMTWTAAGTLMASIEYSSVSTTPLQTPMWIPQTIWVAGLAAFAILSILMAVRAAVLALRFPERLIREIEAGRGAG